MTSPLSVKTNNRFLLFLITASAVFNFCFLEYNNYRIRQDNPANIERNTASLVYGQTIFSIDNEYYLGPAENYIAGKGWGRGAAVGNGDYLRRVPGYSILYYGVVKVFGKQPSAYLFLKIFQLLLFLSTIPAILYLSRLVAKELPAKLVTTVYSFIPFISAWAYYTLTESISPALTIFYFYFALKAVNSEDQKTKLRNYIWASLFFIAAVLTRPYIALAGIVLLAFTSRDYLFPFRGLKGFSRFALAWLLPFVLLSAWTIRNFVLTHEVVLLEKAYHPQSLDRMKPEFRGLFTFTKSWGEDGANLTLKHEPFYWPALAGDTSSGPIHAFINSWPSSIVNEFGYNRLYNILKRHQGIIASYRPYYEQKTAMPGAWTSEQLAVEQEYKQLIKEYRQKHPLTYWVTARLSYLKRMVFHSNTANLHILQPGPALSKPLLVYKSILYLLNVLFFLALILNLLMMKGWTNRLVFVYTPLLFIIFFSFIHREVEARYILPILPLLIVGTGTAIEKMIGIGKQVFISRKKKLVLDATRNYHETLPDKV